MVREGDYERVGTWRAWAALTERVRRCMASDLAGGGRGQRATLSCGPRTITATAARAGSWRPLPILLKKAGYTYTPQPTAEADAGKATLFTSVRDNKKSELLPQRGRKDGAGRGRAAQKGQL
jgi:hypothetical protein